MLYHNKINNIKLDSNIKIIQKMLLISEVIYIILITIFILFRTSVVLVRYTWSDN